MKQELQKLQQESKMGQKSKDVASKDLETTRKKLQDVEAKLKVAVSDKQAALQVRSWQAATEGGCPVAETTSRRLAAAAMQAHMLCPRWIAVRSNQPMTPFSTVGRAWP